MSFKMVPLLWNISLTSFLKRFLDGENLLYSYFVAKAYFIVTFNLCVLSGYTAATSLVSCRPIIFTCAVWLFFFFFSSTCDGLLYRGRMIYLTTGREDALASLSCKQYSPWTRYQSQIPALT